MSLAADKNKLKALKRKEVEMVRYHARKDPWFFITQVLWPEISKRFYDEALHKPLCDQLAAAEWGQRDLFLLPREHCKSYVLDFGHAVWRFIRDPNIRILIISNSDASSRQMLGVIKQIFQFNEGLKYYFPEFHVDPKKTLGNEKRFTHPAREQKELLDPSFRCAYLGESLASRRADIIILDDPIEKKQVATPEQARKALSHFNDTVPIAGKTSNYNMVFVIGTRWAYNDLYANLKGEALTYDEGGIALRDNATNNSPYNVVERHCLENEHGEPDFDNGKPITKHMTRQKLVDILEKEYKVDPDKGEEDWWKQYMNVCQSPKNRKFEEEWFDNWIPTLPGGIVWSGVAIDTALKDEQVIGRGDYTSVLWAHYDAYGHLYLTDGDLSNEWKLMGFLEKLLAGCQRNGIGSPITNCCKEKVAESGQFFGSARDYFIQRGVPFNAIPLTPQRTGSKAIRHINACQQPLQARKVFFVGTDPRTTPSHLHEGFPRHVWQILKDQLVHVGQWANDDVADAFSLFFDERVRIVPKDRHTQQWNVRATAPNQISTPQTNASAWNVRNAVSNTDIRGPDTPNRGLVRRVFDKQ